MIYSIGYQKKSTESLINQIRALGVTHLVDVRSKPYGRKVEFNKNAFSQKLEVCGIRYEHHPELGGFTHISDAALMELGRYQQDKTVCIMCMEADPNQCHRKTEIGARLLHLGIPVTHLI